MCGIAGILGPQSREEGLSTLARMIGAIRHRGPDGQGFTCVPACGGRNLFLGHARLSILDLSDNSAQPMLDTDTGSQLIFNGEIYNYVSLRRDLEAAGHRFASSGDTEVLLHALIEWGTDAVGRLRGMYAFAFWDGRKRQLVLARDPFGIKPLLLMRSGDSVLFASEMRGLVASGVTRFVLNSLGVRSYLAFGTVIEPATIFQGVVSIPPGYVVMTDSEGRLLPPRRITGLDDILMRHVQPDDMSFEGAVDAVQEQLKRSVREHLASDVPVGVFLSGGIDSAVIATLADRAEARPQLTYLTVCFPEEEYSELAYAQQVARGLRGKHESVMLDVDQMLAMLPKALAAMDRPTVDGINTYILSNVAAQNGIKVLVSGLGGDEIFGGYTTFWKTPVLWRHRGVLSQFARAFPAGAFGSVSERAKLVESKNGFDLRDAYLLQRSIRWSTETSGIDLLGKLPDNSLVTPEAWELMATDHRQTDHNRISYLESVFYMRNQLLRDSDVFSSANSVELRVPYLDLDLLDTAWRLPGRYHRSALAGGKRILKSILDKLQPALPLRRRKMGFVFPWQVWLHEPRFLEMVTDTVHTPGAYENLGVKPEEGRRILRGFTERDPMITWAQVWSLFALLNWCERIRREGAI